MRRSLAALAVMAAALGALQARAMWSGRAELRRAARAEDVSERVVHLRRAARWRAPLSPYPGRALAALEAIGREDGDPAASLAAWEAIRGALLATRVVGVADAERLHEAEARIAALRAAPASGEAPRRDLARLARLTPLRGTSAGPAALALLGGLTWVAGGFCLPRRRRLGLGLLAAGLPAFAAGLWLA